MNDSLQGAYLNMIQIGKREPSLPYLQSLIRHHLCRVPFENISKLHYYMHQGKTGPLWMPSLETFLHNRIAKGFGGNCYILNSSFGELLQSLGFQTEIVRATGGNMHLALRVTIGQQSYYVDVGYGAPLFEPLSLERQPHFTRFGEEVIITKLEDDRYRIDRRTNGQSFVMKQIEWKPVTLASFNDAITDSLRDDDGNPFMRRIVATAFKNDTAYSVVNRKLFVKTDKGTELHEYSRERDWMDMMRITFGFDPDALREAQQFLDERGVRLFG
ncbi:arylamine N-acetyltransferase [Paenibacillus mesophilus]|uniref:arylamine N-acetyltransferase n=1 Tax=Paenibacillus mesophilus TaxID=2582849 RepID=UPI00110F16D2|nr:arylamine N-acetyltransferase [Paenibacillus mesophilus]TMV48977.1 arylamine N-acetyltransferase [Paenibacillus mesophilus]